MIAIEVNQLSKTFHGNIKAVNNVSFSISEGHIFGYLGPNGSGKTSCIRLLNGILKNDSGSINFFGKSLNDFGIDIHRICGVMTENAALYENLTAIENLIFFGNMHQLDHEFINKRIDYLLSYLGLTEAANRKCKTYSTGMKKKLSLAISILHNPKVLFLDEPTAALDPAAARDVLELIKRLAIEENKTVFLCSHQLRYIENICNSYGFLKNGKLIANGTYDELLKNIGLEEQLEIRVQLPDKTVETKSFCIQNDEDAAVIISQLYNSGCKIYEAKRILPILEDLYFSYQSHENYE